MICMLVGTIVRAICLCFFFGGQDDDKREREDCPSHITTSSPKKGNAKEFVSVELCRLNTRAHHFHQQHWHCHRLVRLFGSFVLLVLFRLVGIHRRRVPTHSVLVEIGWWFVRIRFPPSSPFSSGVCANLPKIEEQENDTHTHTQH